MTAVTDPLSESPAWSRETRQPLEFAAPLHAPSLLGFFAARAVGGVEEASGATYRRSVRLAHGPAVIAMRLGDDAGEWRPEAADPHGAAPAWRLEAGDERDRAAAERCCRELLDLDADPAAVDGALAADPLLSRLVAAAPGRRVPGCCDPGEIAIRAVLGQQVSVAAARTQAARLVARCGEPLPEPAGGVTHLFPSPAALAALDPRELPMPRARGRSLVTLAAALGAGLDPRERAGLLELPGIGPWTADYVAMRSGDRDVLLETDLGVRRGLGRLGGPDGAGALRRHAERWRPWRSYAVQHLWSVA